MSPAGILKPNVEKMTQRKDVEGLARALKHRDSGIRASAASSLAAVGDSRALEPLLETLSDENDDVRAYVASALGHLQDPRAVEPLIRMLEQDSNDRNRGMAVSALGQIGDARAVEPLLRALEDKDASIRRSAAMWLKDVPHPASVQPLIQALQDDDTGVRVHAALSLGRIGDPIAVEPLNQALDDPNKNVRGAADRALKEMGAYVQLEGIHTLETLCTNLDILDPMSYVSRAVKELAPEGARGSRALARLIVELLDCRSPKLVLVLFAADKLEPTPELIEAVRQVKSASQLKMKPAQSRFLPEIADQFRVGWTDATADGITSAAARVLEELLGAKTEECEG